MLRKLPLLSCLAVAAAVTAMPCLADWPEPAGPLHADRGAVVHPWGDNKHWGEKASTLGPTFPRTQELVKHDNLLPGQNRTQALRLEAQTGHLPRNEEAIVDKAIKQDRGTATRARAHRSAKWQTRSYHWNHR